MLSSTTRKALSLPLARSLATFRVLASDPIDKKCAEMMTERGYTVVEAGKTAYTKEALLEAIPRYHGLIVRSSTTVTREVIEAGRNLKFIGRAGVGVDNIDVKAATAKGIVVMNTPGGNTAAAAELTMSLLMSLARSIPAACASLKAGGWERAAFSKGTELKGKTIGIIGLGQIGRSVALHCKALDMTPLGFDPLMSAEDARALAAAGVQAATLEEIYKRSDFITVHTPLNDATRNLLSAATFAKCKRGVYIINTARGGIVNEADLLAALGTGQVKGAALDVYSIEPPGPASRALLEHPAVLCTPHLGASTEEAQKKVAEEIAVQMCDAFEGTKYFGVVNAPHLGLASREDFKPFVALGAALGALQGQMLFSPAAPARLPKGTRVKIEMEGGPLNERGAGELMRTAVLRGMLPVLPLLEMDAGDVNLVNAGGLAASVGLECTAVSAAGGAGAGGAGTDAAAGAAGAVSYSNTVRVTVTPPGGVGERVVLGSIIDGVPRVVQMDFWPKFPAFIPSGHILFYNNLDVPGQISKVTSVLSEHNVNIASLNVARQFPGSPALSIIRCDSRIPARAVAEITQLEGITRVSTASF